ncbi:hypothetical protein ABT369_20825 [Dactylosporangium sp. NPDC000244]|uniref:hypothetical protein n=1 Tax=Dactylosporangium sp. NPDC000244 TaxID=3154365 RepID=UPI0033260106
MSPIPALPRTMSWRRRTLIGVATGVAVMLLGEVGYISAVSAADDPSIGKIEYTGTPVTDSAVTLQGDSAFANLKVTVSQTRDLTNQAITVSWTGLPARQFSTEFFSSYLQIMQCWGDDPTAPAGQPAPARETCEFGAYDDTDLGRINHPDPAAGGPLRGYTRTRTALRADVDERAATGRGGQPLNYFANAGNITGGSVPFYPVASGWPDVAAGDKGFVAPFGGAVNRAGGGVFGDAESNEQPYATARLDGSGEQTFELQTSLESPWLGCGAPVGDSGHPTGRPCWLVIVPRGEIDDGYAPGTSVTGPGGTGRNLSSPLTAATWKHRLAARLDFRPVGDACPLGTAQRRIIGSNAAQIAFVNWAPTLCSTEKVPYSLTTVAETVARNTIVSSIPGSTRAALVSRPARRDDEHPIAYAPVALSGVAVAFNIERYVTTPDTPQAEQDIRGSRLPRLNLTPRIVAKLLSESYRYAVPDLDKTSGKPAYLARNPATLFEDPDVVAVNPEIKWLGSRGGPSSAAPVVVLENADATRALWEWVNADKDARAFLDGKADPWGMTVNPNYKGIALPVENFPASDPTCTAPTAEEKADGATPVCVIDAAPYAENLADAARRTLTGKPGGVAPSRWYRPDDVDNRDPITNGPGIAHWTKIGTQNVGERFMISVTSTAEAARFGLSTASLRNASGHFVAPGDASLQTAAAAMAGDPDDPRVKVANPAASAAGAYPLPMLTYAAVSVADIDTAADPTAREQLAKFVEYAAGAGQTRGLAFGQLPPGYTPLPLTLKLQAKAAATEIRKGHVAGYGNPDDEPPANEGGGSQPNTNGANAGTAPSAAGSVPARGSVPSAAPARSSRGPEPVAVVQSGRTPDDPAVLPPWVLLLGLGAGLASAFAAPFVRPRRRPSGT